MFHAQNRGACKIIVSDFRETHKLLLILLRLCCSANLVSISRPEILLVKLLIIYYNFNYFFIVVVAVKYLFKICISICRQCLCVSLFVCFEYFNTICVVLYVTIFSYFFIFNFPACKF